MKRILFLIPSLKGGGAERVVSLLTSFFSEKYSVCTILNDTEEIAYSFGGELHKIDINTNLNNKPKFIRKARAFIHLLSVISDYRKKTKYLSPDISISFEPFQNMLNVLSSKKAIISFRSYNLNYHLVNTAFINTFLMRYTVRHAQRIIVPSYGIKELILKSFNLNESKIKVIHNPIHLDYIRKKCEEPLDLPYEEDIFKSPVVINVARLHKAKGHWNLIRAFKKVTEKVPEARLVILGDGPLKEKLIFLSKRLGLEKSIHFLGFKKNPFKYISKASLFVLSSLYEGFANVIVESMACGTPLISTDCKSGPREIIDPRSALLKENHTAKHGEYGILVPPFSNASDIFENTDIEITSGEVLMANEIINLLKNEELRSYYSIKGLERAKDFDLSKIALHYEKLFLEVFNS